MRDRVLIELKTVSEYTDTCRQLLFYIVLLPVLHDLYMANEKKSRACFQPRKHITISVNINNHCRYEDIRPLEY